MSTDLQAAIARTTKTFDTEPGRARVTFRCDSALQEGFQSAVSVRHHTLTVDEPTGIGGSDQGPTPVELVLAALGGGQDEDGRKPEGPQEETMRRPRGGHEEEV